MKYLVFTAALVAAGFGLSQADAMTFSVAGTHDRDTIKSACSHAGGSYSSGAGGYDCIYKDGSGLTCDKNGKCTGYTASRTGGGTGGVKSLKGAMKALSASAQKPAARLEPAAVRMPLAASNAALKPSPALSAAPLSGRPALGAGVSRSSLGK